MAEMTIAGLASEGGVGIETVRFYQRKGLMSEPKRPSLGGRNGGVRRYGAADVSRLRFIKAAQSAGFSLQEIGELLQLDAMNDRARVRKLAEQRVAALNLKIVEMIAARDALTALAKRCARGGAGPCPILGAFEGAALP